LLQAGVEAKEISVLGVGGSTKDVKTKHVFILTYPDFIRNLKRLNSTKFNGVNVYLFAPAIKAKMLKPAKFLDMSFKTKNVNLVKSTFVLPELDLLKGILSADIVDKPVGLIYEDFQARLIDNIKNGSLLNPLMTLIYSLKAGTQIKAKAVIFAWLFSGKKITVLEKNLDNMESWGKLSKRFKTQLVEVLKTEMGKAYREVFAKIGELHEAKKVDKTVTFNPGAIAKKAKLDAYEIRYIYTSFYKPANKTIEGRTLHDIYYARSRNQHKATPGTATK
jgi:hypothetical protein